MDHEGNDVNEAFRRGIKDDLIMRKNFGAKPITYPQPVFVVAAYGEDGIPGAMDAAWAGIK